VIVLLRHASAGDREEWSDDDRLRPLDHRGRRQADELRRLLAELGISRVLTSPYVRCVDTVVPLARHLDVDAELSDALAEGGSRAEALEHLREAGDGVVHCTHGDVIELLLGRPLKKGMAALVELRGDELHVVKTVKV
jgi:phosphohistidine phosphatase SixA